MLLSQNQKIFSEFFCPFPKFAGNLQYFEKKNEPRTLFVSEIIDCKTQGSFSAEKGAY